jgi:hypothetical protein
VLNFYNEEYTVKLSLGTPPQDINFGLNLMNDYTLVPLDTCDCHASNTWYSPSQSSTFKNTSEGFVYPGTWWDVKGHWAKESFYVKKDEIKKTDFIAIKSDNGLEGFAADGFLGLGFGLAGDGHESLISYMKSKGIIKKAIFSVYLNNYLNSYKKSALTIGTWKPEDYSNGAAAIIKVDKFSAGWETKIGGMWVDRTRVFSGSDYLVFDLLESTLILSQSAYNAFVVQLQKAEPSCKDYGFGYLHCKCTYGDYTKFPDISFGIDAQQFLVHAENYLNYVYNDMCEVMVDPNLENDVWVIGLPFFREYYSMFDLEHREIRLARAMREGWFYNTFKVYQSGIAFASVVIVGAIALAFKRRDDGYQLVN